MEIKTEQKVEKVTILHTSANYSVEDIKKLIEADLVSKGYNVDDIYFKTNYKYVSDEWGMNRHIQTLFEGAFVEVYKEIVK